LTLRKNGVFNIRFRSKTLASGISIPTSQKITHVRNGLFSVRSVPDIEMSGCTCTEPVEVKGRCLQHQERERRKIPARTSLSWRDIPFAARWFQPLDPESLEGQNSGEKENG
jgi:hypothetical protein